MQIILLEKVVNLGNLGDIVKVKDGYARNFLIPSGSARRARFQNGYPGSARSPSHDPHGLCLVHVHYRIRVRRHFLRFSVCLHPCLNRQCFPEGCQHQSHNAHALNAGKFLLQFAAGH